MSYPTTNQEEQKIPQCIFLQHCDCFNLINKPIFFVAGNNYEQYISESLKWVDSYYTLLKIHKNKDILYNTFQFATLPAYTIKCGLDHLYNNLSIFESFIHFSNVKSFLIHLTPIKSLPGSQILLAFKNTSYSYAYLIETFKSPYTPLNSDTLINILEIHLFCLSIFDQFYNLIRYGCNIYGKLEVKNAYKITLSIDR
jgi:hypothetical protein